MFSNYLLFSDKGKIALTGIILLIQETSSFRKDSLVVLLQVQLSASWNKDPVVLPWLETFFMSPNSYLYYMCINLSETLGQDVENGETKLATSGLSQLSSIIPLSFDCFKRTENTQVFSMIVTFLPYSWTWRKNIE